MACGNQHPTSTLSTCAATLAGRLLQMLIATAATFHLEIHQLDATNAFPHAKIDEIVYIPYSLDSGNRGTAFDHIEHFMGYVEALCTSNVIWHPG